MMLTMLIDAMNLHQHHRHYNWTNVKLVPTMLIDSMMLILPPVVPVVAVVVDYYIDIAMHSVVVEIEVPMNRLLSMQSLPFLLRRYYPRYVKNYPVVNMILIVIVVVMIVVDVQTRGLAYSDMLDSYLNMNVINDIAPLLYLLCLRH